MKAKPRNKKAKSAPRSHAGMDRLLDVVRRLRARDGCPWDREQTLNTLKQYLIEESYELLDAVDSGDPLKHKEELGDVLLQVVLHAQIRDEEKKFDFDSVAAHLADKLVRRHPHVFGDVEADTSEKVLKNWEIIKAREHKDASRSIVDGIPRHLPALQKAQRIQSRVARVGFDWEKITDVIAKIREEVAELEDVIGTRQHAKIREEMGDVLFSIVNLSRFCNVLAEEALDSTNKKFMARFRKLEDVVRSRKQELTDCTPGELDAIWSAVKKTRRR